MPTVSIAPFDPGIPHISVDNHQAMRLVLTHLIEQHNYRRIAILRGPLLQHEAEERYQGYCGVMAGDHLPVDPELVLLGDFTKASGADAIAKLSEPQRETAGRDCRLQRPDGYRRGRGAPSIWHSRSQRCRRDRLRRYRRYGSAVRGHQTARQPIYEQGKWAVEALLARLQGGPPTQTTQLPATLVIRQSCGCSSLMAHEPFSPASAVSRITNQQEAHDSWAQIVSQAEPIFAQPGLQLASDFQAQLVAAYADGLQNGDSTRFLLLLREQVESIPPMCERIYAWQETSSALHRNASIPSVCGAAPSSRARSFMMQATAWGNRVFCLVKRESRLKDHFTVSNAIERSLTTTRSFEQLANVIIREVPR